MGKSKKNKNVKYITVENAIDAVTFVNAVTLTATEKVFDISFDVTEKLQSFTDKLMKKGFKFSAKQYDTMFDTLEDTKEKTVKTYKKVSKRFNKEVA